jgi:hypothetical protein
MRIVCRVALRQRHMICDILKVLSMTDNQSTDEVVYNPNKVLDAVMDKLQLKNDAALSRALEVAPPVISKIRHHTLMIGATILIRMHEVSGLSIRELRELMSTKNEGASDAA